MVRRVWWLGVLLAVSCAGMTSSSASSGWPAQPSGQIRETPSGPVWMPRLPYQGVSATPRMELKIQTASSDRGTMALAASGIPVTALEAYRGAAALIARSDPSCNLHWSLLAAIGRVESDHGRHGGSTIGRDGQVVPPILGPPLNGAGVALIRDSDGGRYDRDTVFDRAVGAMQFLPGTWRMVGADGSDDGVADPGNIFDAALSAGRYLCGGATDLNDHGQLRAAVYRYNHSVDYVNLVLALAEAYRNGGEPDTPVVAAAPPPSPVDRDLPPATTGRPPAVDPSGPPFTIGPSRGGGSPRTPPPSFAWSMPPSKYVPPPSSGSGGASPPVRTDPPGDSPPGTSPPGTSAPGDSPPDTQVPTSPPTSRTPTPSPSEPAPTPAPTPTPSPSPSPSPSPKPPAISSVDPETASAGTTVTLTGKRFASDSSVTLVRVPPKTDEDEPIALEAEYHGDDTLKVTLPKDLKPGPYRLTVTTDGATSDPAEIEVTED